MSYELEVVLDDRYGWIGNACYYETRDEATRAGVLISANSIRVREMRVMPRSHPITHRFDRQIGRTVLRNTQEEVA